MAALAVAATAALGQQAITVTNYGTNVINGQTNIVPIVTTYTPITINGTTSPQPPSPINAANTVYAWVTSFSTNTWNGTHGFAETGAAYQHQLQFADVLTVGANIYTFSTNGLGLTVSDTMLNAGIAGTIVNDAADLSLRYDYKDVQLLAGAGPGWYKPENRYSVDAKLELQKKPTANTHLSLGIGDINKRMTVFACGGVDF